MKLQLPSGLTYGIDKTGNRVCTGTQMGRRNIWPANPNAPIKVRLEKLRLVDGAYDQWGPIGALLTTFTALGTRSRTFIFSFGPSTAFRPKLSSKVVFFPMLSFTVDSREYSDIIKAT